MRNLARRGTPVSCVDCDDSLPGFHQRYGKTYKCPNPDTESKGWLRFMLELAESFKDRPALIPASDRFLMAIATHADSLSKAYRIGGDAKLQGVLSEKESLYSLAATHGMPIPRTGKVRTEADVLEFAKAATFPCLLKPMAAREWEIFPPGHLLHLSKVAVANNTEELLSMYRIVGPVSPVLSIQEIIAGPDTAKLVYFSCYGREGNRIARAMFRELRCQPEGFGCASVCEACVDDEADALCDGFLRRLGCRGLCEIELKRDSRDGGIKMIEANPRLSGSGDAATYAGVDLAWIHYLDLIGQDITPVAPNGRDVRHIMLRSDVLGLRSMWNRGELKWGDISRTYKWPLAFYDMDASDLRFAARTLYDVAHIVSGAVFRRFVPKRNRIVA